MATAVLFDLDGVLVNTEGQYTQFWKSLGASLLPGIPDLAERIKGMTLTQILQKYFMADPNHPAAVREALDAFEETMTFPIIAGSLEFIQDLRAAGFKTAVVTSSDTQKMARLYAAHPDFTSHFDRIFTAEDATRSKPAPDCYIAAARSLGYEAAECFVFEDSLSGLQAGRDSGATVIALTTSHPAERLKELAKATIPDFTHITVAQMCGYQNK